MQMTALRLATPDIDAQRTFYTETLGLSLVQASDVAFTVRIGDTQLTFQATPERGIVYHFAIIVPHNKWQQAREWIGARVPILAHEGREEFVSLSGWNSRSLYFYDAAGNILEFIAHYDLPVEAGDGFGVGDMQRVSEIGLVVDDVPAQVENLRAELGLEVYRNSFSDTFAAVGDTYGLFIVVKKGRPWMPTFEIPAVVSPVQVTMRGVQQRGYQLAPYPYTIEAVPASLTTR